MIRSRAIPSMTGPMSALGFASVSSTFNLRDAADHAVAQLVRVAADAHQHAEPAMQRWPALPKAQPRIGARVESGSASGMTSSTFFAPPALWHALAVLAAQLVDVTCDARRADEAERRDLRVRAQRVHRPRARRGRC